MATTAAKELSSSGGLIPSAWMPGGPADGGGLALGSLTPGAFRPDDLEMIKMVAGQVKDGTWTIAADERRF